MTEDAEPSPDPVPATVEALIRHRLSEAFGGARGSVETALPTVAFVVAWVISHEVKTSVVIALVVAVGLGLVRVVQRSSLRHVLGAVGATALAAWFAMRSGKAEDAFLPGILLSLGYGVAMLASMDSPPFLSSAERAWARPARIRSRRSFAGRSMVRATSRQYPRNAIVLSVSSDASRASARRSSSAATPANSESARSAPLRISGSSERTPVCRAGSARSGLRRAAARSAVIRTGTGAVVSIARSFATRSSFFSMLPAISTMASPTASRDVSDFAFWSMAIRWLAHRLVDMS